MRHTPVRNAKDGAAQLRPPCAYKKNNPRWIDKYRRGDVGRHRIGSSNFSHDTVKMTGGGILGADLSWACICTHSEHE
jgi:hypothetical protein